MTHDSVHVKHLCSEDHEVAVNVLGSELGLRPEATFGFSQFLEKIPFPVAGSGIKTTVAKTLPLAQLRIQS